MQKKWLELALPIAIVLCIFVIYLPVPTGLMDLMLAANITLAVVLLLSAVFARSPLELSVFPALLLVTTLGRLALNVATTRLILTRGPIDKELAAGEVVRAFGEFVTGDNLLVGLIIFAILFIVQFVVITKGATRIGEVSARFALDGLPGRQMAIDADLSSGMIDLEEAQRRRRELLRQADFHGAMDGASKYVRGDAIAGLLITFINITAGLGLGLYHNMSLSESTTTFTKLTIGDGLVTQLPALLISIAAALLVSRGSDESNLPRDSILQLFSNPYVLAIASGLMALLSFTELPQAPLLTISLVTGGLAFYKFRRPQLSGLRTEGSVKATPATELPIERLLEIDSLEVHLGADLIGLADARQGGTVIAEIGNMRKRLCKQFMLVIPIGSRQWKGSPYLVPMVLPQ